MLDLFFFFNDTATTEIYTLSLHDALPISVIPWATFTDPEVARVGLNETERSEEHTSELQSRLHLVCRLLLEKKKHVQHIQMVLLRRNNNRSCFHLHVAPQPTNKEKII